MATTIYDIAKQAGVSAMTVSRVLNRKGGAIPISPQTIKRVRKAAQELNYTPDILARALRKGRSSLIGVVVPHVTFSYLAEVIEGMESVARERQSSIVLCTTAQNPGLEREYVKLLVARKVDGLIIWPVMPKDELEELVKPLIDKGRAVVFIYRNPEVAKSYAITVDTRYGGYLATKHLIEKGHVRIGCRDVAKTNVDVLPVVEGHKEALREYGIKIDTSLFKEMSVFHEGCRVVKEYMIMRRPPTAIYTTGDYQAMGVIQGASEMGLSVPGDLAVVGFNDIEAASMCVPPLTTVRVPKKEVGEMAVRCVYERLEAQDHFHHVFKPELVVRKST